MTPKPANTQTAELMCEVHSLDGINDDSRTRVAIYVGDSSFPQPAASFQQGQPITICEQYQLNSVTGILRFINGKSRDEHRHRHDRAARRHSLSHFGCGNTVSRELVALGLYKRAGTGMIPVCVAARQASVGQFGSQTCTLAGVSSSTPTGNLMCDVHSLDGFGTSDDNDTRVAIAVGDTSHNAPNSTTGAYAQGQPITICEQYQLHSTTGILPFINSKVATSTATDMISTVNSSNTLSTAAETQFPGAPAWPSQCTKGPPPAS